MKNELSYALALSFLVFFTACIKDDVVDVAPINSTCPTAIAAQMPQLKYAQRQETRPGFASSGCSKRALALRIPG